MKPRTLAMMALLSVVLAGWTGPKGHPLESKITGNVTLENWQPSRAYGLRSFHRIARDFMSVNAEKIRPLKVEPDYGITELPAVKALTRHPALDALLIVRGEQIQFEHYANGMTPTSFHACQSASKTTVNLLAGKAVVDRKLDLDAAVETYIASIGGGYRGRSVSEVLAMNVKHELDYFVDPGDLFDKEESSMGWRPSKVPAITRRDFIESLQGGNPDGSNETEEFVYATANTDLGGWIVESATKAPSHQAMREILHAIGGENTVYMATDRTGVPIVGAGLVMTLRDLARFGLLLGSGGMGVDQEVLGGGPEFVEETMTKGQVRVLTSRREKWYYINSVYASGWGIGHPGLGGQLIWADPASKTVIAVFSGFTGPPARETVYYNTLFDVVIEVVEHNRGKK